MRSNRMMVSALMVSMLVGGGFRHAVIAQGAKSSPSAASLEQIDTTQGAKPCADDTERRRFDFWTGAWDVMTKEGVRVGRSDVHLVSGGCGLLENWTSVRGPTGKSLNAYNPQTRQWEQFWVGQGGLVTEYRESEWNGTSLSFIARPAASSAPAPPTLRLTFTPLDDGSVRQHGEQSTDGGKTWATTYDLYYRRRP